MVVKKKKRKNQEGFAIVETIPMIFIFITLTGFTLGFYGVSQRMILSSIAARSYGIELMRHRANISYLRDIDSSGSAHAYHLSQSRFFASRASRGGANDFIAERMPINILDFRPADTSSVDSHNTTAYSDLSRGGSVSRRNSKHLFNPVWVRNAYGICLRAACGE